MPENSDSLNSKVTWWILGIVGSIMLLGITVLFRQNDSLQVRINALEINAASSGSNYKNTEARVQDLSKDQISIYTKINELSSKLDRASVENAYLKEQVNQLRVNLSNGKSIGP